MTPAQEEAVRERIIQEARERTWIQRAFAEQDMGEFTNVAHGYFKRRHLVARFLRWLVGV